MFLQGEGLSVCCHFLSGYLVPCSFQGSLSLWSHVSSGGGGLCPVRSLSGGLCPGRLCPGGSLSRRSLSRVLGSLSRGGSFCPGVGVSAQGVGVSVQGGGGLCPGGSPLGDPPGQRTPHMVVKSGRYASYWNAFLFHDDKIRTKIAIKINNKKIEKLHQWLQGYNLSKKSYILNCKTKLRVFSDCSITVQSSFSNSFSLVIPLNKQRQTLQSNSRTNNLKA